MKKIGFIGAGTMAKAIINGVIASGIVSKDDIMASEINEEAAKRAAEETGVQVVTDNLEVAKASDVIVLAVKPHIIETVLIGIKETLTSDKLIVSIAAGLSTQAMETTIGANVPVIRVMPNTPVLVGEGMSAICRGKFATDTDAEFVLNLFRATGKCIEVEEKNINAVTGISGSGPAFMYLIIEALADGGVKMGLKKEAALELAAQTALGASKMVFETGKHPAVLKDEVATPGGCTIAGLSVMESENVRSALIKTVQKTAETASGLS